MASMLKILSPFIIILASAVSLQAREESVSYNRDIRPLLADRCFACHGPDEAKREANLRLDVIDGEFGPFQSRDGLQAIKPADVNASELWNRLITDDPALQMPPPESNKRPLTELQREQIRTWIEQGAKYENFWSFEPPRAQTLPSVKNTSWPAGRIDQFVLATLERLDKSPQPPTDKRTLLRRVTLDLTGLPPTREEISEFDRDESPEAYSKVVDRLLSRPQYGEHMARYWLDLVRFADTNGMHHDHYRELSQYRDWVIRAYNANMPFDKFTMLQLAGDLIPEVTPLDDAPECSAVDRQIASGYNRLHMVMDRGTNPPQESYTRNVVDQVVAFGTVYLGMTLECSVCHDHKYDPIKQRDFYQLFAFFNNIDGDPETPGRDQQPPMLRLPTDDQTLMLADFDSKISITKSEVEKLKRALAGFNKENAKKAELPDAKSTPTESDSAQQISELESQIKQKESEQKALQNERNELDRSVTIALVMKERAEQRPSYILKRGAYDQPGEQVYRNTPAFLPAIQSSGETKSRLDLARWVTDRRNPLMARVTVNRFWQQLFGVGLVKTSEDFGSQGEFPSHPELLDDLATSFIDSAWDVKALIRSMVLSSAYQQSSRVAPAEYRADSENRLLARGGRVRLDSEVIRDQVLAISGLLNSEMYGKSVKPPQPTDLWKTVSMVSSSTYSFKQDTGDKIYRRSFYTFWKRAMPPPQMTIFDAPTRESCTSRRERTNTPVQALLMMNESQYFEAARHFAQQLMADLVSDEQRILAAFESVTSQLPDDVTLAELKKGLEAFRSIYRDDVEAARAMNSDLSIDSDDKRIELASLTMIVNSLFNLDTAKTRE